jgi:uncharacterized protein
MSLVVKCPICQSSVPWNDDAKFKPFCSERCKLIDLGDWASEKHVIPVKSPFEAGLLDPDLLDDAGFQQDDFFKE